VKLVKEREVKMCECFTLFFRALFSLALGIPLGVVPGLLTSVAVIIITLIRYPLNFYKTFRVTIVTALLKKRLKFLILLSLILIQIIYPVIGVIVAIVVSVVGWCGACVACCFSGEGLFTLLGKIPSVCKEYWKWHESFYKETLEKYNHPSGVPMNWDGRRYDVPNFGFKKTVVGVLLTIYGPIVVTLGTIFILLVKYLPIQLHALFRYLRLITEINCAFLPFWLVGIPLVVGIGPILLVLAVLAAPLLGLRCPYIAIKHDSLKSGLREAFVTLSKLDGVTAGMGWNCRINPKVEHPREEFTLPTEQETPGSEKYWPHFVAACKEVSRSSLEKGWMTSEDLEGCMPNVLQAVPALAILDIIRRSVAAEPTVESIHWTEKDRCDAKTCRKDDLADFFWPKLMKVRKQVKEAKEEELDYLRAKLCANSEEVAKNLALAMEESKVSEEKKRKTHRIAADINNIVIVLLRMEQMQKRLPDIMLQKPDTDGEGGGGGGSEANPDSGANPESEANPDEAAEANYDVDRNEDAEVEP